MTEEIKKKKSSYTKTLLKLITCNFKTVIKFELLFKILTIFIFLPLATGGFSLTMKLTGYSYLTFENMKEFLLNPLTIILLLIIILYLTLVTMFDITTLIIIFDQSKQGNKITIRDAIKLSIRKSLVVFNPKNILLPFFLLFIIPFLNISMGTSVISSIDIPEFIDDYIFNNDLLFLLLVIVTLFLVFLLSNWLYSIHYMTLENKSFRQARKKSIVLVKKNRLKDALTIAITEVLEIVLYIIVVIVGIMLIFLINYYLSKIIIIESALITIIWLFIAFSLIIFFAFSNALNYAIISSLYYKHKEDNEEEVKHITYTPTIVNNKKNNTAFKIAKWIILIVCIISGTVLTHQVVTGHNNLNIEYIRNMEITAHRGASVDYPENTMAAFKGAKEKNADWIELDVEQTKDKKIVVIHDSNLKRLTGVNKDVIDLTYDEISKLDAGSHFSKEFAGEKIPLLEDVIKFAINNNIRLNIEIKPTGKEDNIEQGVIDIIEKYDFKDRCIVTSLHYEVLENIKKINPKIKTFYVMSIAVGDVTKLDKADGFSIEASNLNKSLINKIHNEGKEVLAWTVNTEENIDKMIDLGVDNIITDNITLAKELVAKSKSSNLISEVIKILESLFK